MKIFLVSPAGEAVWAFVDNISSHTLTQVQSGGTALLEQFGWVNLQRVRKGELALGIHSNRPVAFEVGLIQAQIGCDYEKASKIARFRRKKEKYNEQERIRRICSSY